MEPSSLIFVAIIGVWAAYLVPHWLRKRDDLVQSRTLDRFSQRLRVLQRRSRPMRSGEHRSGAPVLSSPRLVVDTDGEFLYIPGDRAPVTKTEPMNRPQPAAVSESVAGSESAPAVEPSAKPERIAVPAPVQAAAPEPITARETQTSPPARSFDLEQARVNARVAARRRAVGMILLLAATVGSWLTTMLSSLTAWVALPATLLLVAHALASRVAGLRSRAGLTLLEAQLYAAELAHSRPRRAVVVQAEQEVAAVPVESTPQRVARRAATVGAHTWEPVPVPPPTYTLKPAVHRPDPAPLSLPAAQPATPAAAAVSRGALPRRASDIERILALESDVDKLFDEPKVVNG